MFELIEIRGAGHTRILTTRQTLDEAIAARAEMRESGAVVGDIWIRDLDRSRLILPDDDVDMLDR